jgi:hypothetical protein
VIRTTTTITIMRYQGIPTRWWPKVHRFGPAGRRVYEIDWLRVTVMVR